MSNTEAFDIEDQGNPCKFSTSWFDFPASRQDLAFTRLNHDSNGEPHTTGPDLRSRVFVFAVAPVLV